ncbi:TIGR04028 family ABC transporter substrate-binding protein [Brevibacterium sp. BRM-1]|uniref:TIGR04028 family ABC transporter substrate-binding protein n=1 Tax=Brevibacterium sp. BRM-1 TaxID=2999062 RepID=UPI00227E6568|nr:TIGR04028 family ABC transporter substrate-binding protein [Brevibacterium sp. BRM-1]WAL39423.1 TIGR04028 family ABC transporter substrate-binding protein [Brevibacterium sp. BRM-1]
MSRPHAPAHTADPVEPAPRRTAARHGAPADHSTPTGRGVLANRGPLASHSALARRSVLGLGLGAGSALALSACARPDTDPAEGGSPLTGGVLVYFDPQAWQTLYPPQVGFYPNGGIMNNIADRLLWQDPSTLELHPWIAESLPRINDDATAFTFRLRPGVTHSDGSPLDAANVKRNMDLYGLGDDKRQLPPSEQISNYVSGEVLDSRTVRFRFSAPSPGFAQAVSVMNAGLLSNATLTRDSQGFGPGSADRIIASGPFVVESEELGTRLRLRARTDYDWAPPHLPHQGRPYLDGVEIIVGTEYSVRVGALVSGQADAIRQVDAPDEARLAERGLRIVAAATNGVTNSIAMRFPHPLLSDQRVREALIAAVDRKRILTKLFTDNYPLATGILAHSAQGYKRFDGAWRHDPAQASRLLDAAGWARDGGATRVKDGAALALRVNDALPQPRSKEVMTLVQEDLAKVGIALSINPGDMATQDADALSLERIQLYHSMVGRADFDVIKSQFAGTRRNALLNYDADTKEYRDPRLEKLLDRVSSEPQEAGRRRASWAVQDRLVDRALVLPLFEEPQVYGFRRRVRGFACEAVGRPAFYDTWLADAGERAQNGGPRR